MTPQSEDKAREVFIQALRFDFSMQVLMIHAVNKLTDSSKTKLPDGTLEATFDNTVLHTPPTMVSAFTCEAFAVELYIKAICCLEGIVYKPDHRLDKFV
jgi:hypothetical protein